MSSELAQEPRYLEGLSTLEVLLEEGDKGPFTNLKCKSTKHPHNENTPIMVLDIDAYKQMYMRILNDK